MKLSDKRLTASGLSALTRFLRGRSACDLSTSLIHANSKARLIARSRIALELFGNWLLPDATSKCRLLCWSPSIGLKHPYCLHGLDRFLRNDRARKPALSQCILFTSASVRADQNALLRVQGKVKRQWRFYRTSAIAERMLRGHLWGAW